MEIHCEEMLKKGFDKKSLQEVKKMIGFYEPEGKNWDVTIPDGIYSAKTQFEAEVISSLHEIKSLLLKRRR
jgi:hypothetical protein